MNSYNKVSILVADKPLKPGLMLAGKAGAYPSEAAFSCELHSAKWRTLLPLLRGSCRFPEWK
jgi:hypothetical protein